ncbi:hypothetical protein COU91_03130 [Candidatus Saccharibacteria bacterium CG10_big_fil_rev_8_21_14_0_10_47_8]|nr:MAG: hypothetical protein COU91_03130 [Candidatus Saccharibacteria bacterium CG10_big_fil_rev_8_21_14_0_10_47_8]
MSRPVPVYHRNFEKQLAKLPQKQRDKAIDAIEEFVSNPLRPSLRVHALKGKWSGYISISAGGDLRLHFKPVNGNKILFVAVGTHAQLYR